MATMEITSTVSLGGISNTCSLKRSYEGAVVVDDITLPAGVAATLGARTDTDTCIVTMPNTSHGYTTDSLLDVYFSGGKRQKMTVTGVTGAAIVVDGGVGDSVPTPTGGACVVSTQTTLDVALSGTDAKGFVFYAADRAAINVEQADGTLIKSYEVGAAANDDQRTWMSDAGVTNPFTGVTIGKVMASAGVASTVAAKVGFLYDAV